MKQVMIILAMLLTLSGADAAASQRHRHTPAVQHELADSTAQDAVEAYSDTASVADEASADDEWDEAEPVSPVTTATSVLESLDDGIVFAIIAMVIVFILSPVLILIVLFYFINKNRKQKLKLAQVAMQNGQPIPEQLFKEDTPERDDDYRTGIKQVFLGLGLMVFLGSAVGRIGFGVGVLIFFIGLGKVVIAKLNQKNNNNNELMPNNYEQ